jgi:hypothetical protein
MAPIEKWTIFEQKNQFFVWKVKRFEDLASKKATNNVSANFFENCAILYHKVSWTPELSVCVKREVIGAPKRRAFHIDAMCFKVMGIPVSPV